MQTPPPFVIMSWQQNFALCSRDKNGMGYVAILIPSRSRYLEKAREM